MRVTKTAGPLSVKAIAGTRVVLMALDLDPGELNGLRGFAIKRGEVGGPPADFLTGIKYFASLVPNPVKGAKYSTRNHPLQSFLWSDYAAKSGTQYTFTVAALYGPVGGLQEKHTVQFNIKTHEELEDGHGIWFNRGAIASQELARDFQNKKLVKAAVNNVDGDGKVLDGEVRFLSRGLEEALMDYINGAGSNDGLRVCAYEFTYAPVLDALKRALNRGVDVQIVYHGVPANAKAIAAAKLPKTHGGKKVLFERTKTKIPHNKFIVKLAGGKAKAVWTGSTNFTDTGLFGQTNVGHLVVDDGVAARYLDYWKELSGNPVHSVALANAIALTPNPRNAIAKDSIVAFYSPRTADNMLDWYGQRIDDGASMAAMTIPFNVAPTLLKALSRKLESIRVVILEDVPTKEVRDAEFQNKGLLVFSNGAILGKNLIKFKAGGGKVTPVPKSHIDDWFLSEELARPINQGHVFFMHAKFVLIDPLSDDPLVCSGSANFSTNSLEANDENMLLIRGSKRVADIYLTEFDRIFRHFYTRDAINRIASKGNQKNPLELDETGVWIAPNFKKGTYKNNRRLMFFPKAAGGAAAAQPWSKRAAADPDPFADEVQRAKDKKAKKAAAAKARKAKGKKKPK